MKITKSQLKRIIKEELGMMESEESEYEGIPYDDRYETEEREARRGRPSSEDDELLEDLWMDELNGALVDAMAGLGLGNSIRPSSFLDNLVYILEIFGVPQEKVNKLVKIGRSQLSAGEYDDERKF